MNELTKWSRTRPTDKENKIVVGRPGNERGKKVYRRFILSHPCLHVVVIRSSPLLRRTLGKSAAFFLCMCAWGGVAGGQIKKQTNEKPLLFHKPVLNISVSGTVSPLLIHPLIPSRNLPDCCSDLKTKAPSGRSSDRLMSSWVCQTKSRKEVNVTLPAVFCFYQQVCGSISSAIPRKNNHMRGLSSLPGDQPRSWVLDHKISALVSF